VRLEALIEQAEVQLSYTRLTSPIPGVTGVRQIDVGNIIHPTDPNGLVVIAQVEPISLIFTLPQSELPRIQMQMAKGPLTVIAYSQDDKIKLDEGELLLVNNQIAQATGTIQLKATFPNTAHRLWPGQLVNARLLVETRKDGLTIAAPAVQQGQTGSYVYVISPEGKAEVRPVTVAQISEGEALIDSGLTSIKLDTTTIAGAGDLAYGRGRYPLTISPPSGTPVQDAWKYVVVYRCQANGAWRAVTDIFNSDQPAQQ